MTLVADLHMARLVFDTGRLLGTQHRLRLPPLQSDYGYLVHCRLRELFQEEAPAPFCIVEGASRTLTVLGYSRVDAQRLRRSARRGSLHTDAGDLLSVESKRLPSTWTSGSRYAFEVRACPVRRLSKGDPDYRKGAEIDIFLAECRKVASADIPVNREAVYCDWMCQHLERDRAAAILGLRLARFRRQRLVRRTQGEQRRARLLERPDATLAGELEVTDADAFGRLMARGVGRHRAFGFGMLLLRRMTGTT